MTISRYLSAALISAAIGMSFGPTGELGWSRVHAQEAAKGETLRPEVGKRLQAVQELMRLKRYSDALAKIREIDDIGNKTPYETYTIERMRGAVASAAGDMPVAIKSFEAVIASGRMRAAEQLTMEQAVAGSYYRAKDYPKAVATSLRYFKDGGKDPQMHVLLSQSYYLNNDFGNAAKELQAELKADEQVGREPAEDRLQLLANCYSKQNDNAAYVGALEQLVAHYPKKEYWSDIITRIQRKPGFGSQLSLDVFRLKLATGTLSGAADFIEMAQLALQAGFAFEAKKIVDLGFSSGAFQTTGPDADRQNRLKNLVTQTVATDQKNFTRYEAEATSSADGIGLVNLGYALVSSGQFDKGIPLMEEGIRKGGIKHPEDAELHLGIAYWQAGQKAKALPIFKTVKGAQGASDLARLWTLQARQTSK
jgi:hypothetical protein